MSSRFNYKYKIDSDTLCWIVTSHQLHPTGYIFVNRQHNKGYLHRIIFEETHGKIPEGQRLRRVCNNRDCVNPDHMSLKHSSSE